jgi:exosortase K
MQRIATIQPHMIFYPLLIFLMAAGLKYHYSHADSGDLYWILKPTAGMVEWISGMAFDHEEGAGFVNRTHRLVIAPSCAGVNFLITMFCMAALSGFNRFSRTGTRCAWACASIVIAIFSTVMVNAARIVASFHIYRADIYSAWLTPERVHRAGGVVLYFLALSVLYLVLMRIIRFPAQDRQRGEPPGTAVASAPRRILHSGAVPAAWYLTVAIGVPLLNVAYLKGKARFAEHTLTVAITCLIVFILIALIRLSFNYIAAKMGPDRTS